ncbi:MAG TPA: ATP-grasp domain-containing protein [Thermoleophilia bacterium]|nr:ATP-grasp domain-containing protein [Thermoleophilia bacterium]
MMIRLLEHHGLDLLRSAGIGVAAYRTADSPEAAAEAARALGDAVVVKALIPTGGRGKVGAVRRAGTPAEAAEAARALLGSHVGHFPVRQVLVQVAVDIREEYFAAITFDSMTRTPVMLFSVSGGMEVEDLVNHHPEALVIRPIEPILGLPLFIAREVAEGGGLKGDRLLATASALGRLYRVFRENDAFLVEVNPLAVDQAGEILAPSVVVTLDIQARFRHPEWGTYVADTDSNGWRSLTPLERCMRDIDATDLSSVIRFNEFSEGRIACLITGGGGGLVALDQMQRLGEMPATTFDITPGQVEEKMYLATKAILGRPGLRGLIAGGNISNFIRVDVKVRGVVRALKDSGVDPRRFPVVFRYGGPGVEAARALAEGMAGIEFYDEGTPLEDAVARIVERVRTITA